MNDKVKEIMDKEKCSERTAYRRVNCGKRIKPEVKALIDQGFSNSYAYRKFKKNAPNRANRKNGIYAFSKGEWI